MNPHTKPPTSPLAATSLIWQQRNLLLQLSWRAIRQRYQASVLGVLWSLLSPLLMLTIYTLLAALFQCVLNLSIVLLAVAWTNGQLSWRVLQLPLVLAPFVLLLLGFAWLGFFWFQKTRKGFADVL